MFLRSLYRFQGEEYSEQEIASRCLGNLRQMLRDENLIDLKKIKVGPRTLPLHIDSMTRFNIIRLGKY